MGQIEYAPNPTMTVDHPISDIEVTTNQVDYNPCSSNLGRTDSDTCIIELSRFPPSPCPSLTVAPPPSIRRQSS